MNFQDLCDLPRTRENLRLARLYMTGPTAATAIAAWWSSAPIFEYTNNVCPLPILLSGNVSVATGTTAAVQAAFSALWAQRVRAVANRDGGEITLAGLKADLTAAGALGFSDLALATASPQPTRLAEGGLLFPSRRPPMVGTSTITWIES